MTEINAQLNRRLLGQKRSRAWEIDFLRGLCIVLVVFDHMMFDFWGIVPGAANYKEIHHWFFARMADFASLYWVSDIRAQYIRVLVVFTFLFLSGISCTFSRSNKNRFFKLAAAASAVTLVTFLIDAVAGFGLIIAFGILHIMALNVLVYMILKKLFAALDALVYTVFEKRCPRQIFYGVCAAAGAAMTLYGMTLSTSPVKFNIESLWPAAMVSVLFLLYPLGKMVQKNLRKNGFPPQKDFKIRIIASSAFGALFLIALIGLIVLLPAQSFGVEEFKQFGRILWGTGSFGSDFYGVFPYTGVFLLGVAAGGILYREKRSLIPVLDRPIGPIGLAVTGVAAGFLCGIVLSYLEGAPGSPLLSLLLGGGGGLVFYGFGAFMERAKKKESRSWHAALGFVGRNAIWVYLAHQVIVFAIIVLSAMAVGYKFF